MKTFKLNFIDTNGRLLSRKVQATNKAEARKLVPYVLLGVYEVNSVGAIIG